MDHARSVRRERNGEIRTFKDSPEIIWSRRQPSFLSAVDDDDDDDLASKIRNDDSSGCHGNNHGAMKKLNKTEEETCFRIPAARHSSVEQKGLSNLDMQFFVKTSTPNPKPLKQLDCRCCCHRTHHHHHHHHHTIVINGHQISNASSTVNRNPSRSRVLKTPSCPSSTDSFRKSGRSTEAVDGTPSRGDATNRYPIECLTSAPHSKLNCSNSIRHAEQDFSNDRRHRSDYRLQNPVIGKKCCRKPSIGMFLLLAVLIIVIISLMSGLIYFLVRGNVSQSDSFSPKKNVPSIKTVLNQTTICGKFPEKYYPLSPRTINKKYSNLYPPENDHRLNISLAGRIIGGVPANIAQYPWQIADQSSMADNLVDASMVQGRIFGGSDTAASRFPWQVSLWVKHRGKTCGGSLIMEDWVLTAAHCTDTNSNPDLWTAYMGMSLMTGKSQPPAQSSKVLSIIQHPKYISDFSYDYDVSILKLKTPVLYSPTVQPICLPDATAEYQDGAKCYISGWGATTNSGEPNAPNTLQHAQVDIIGDNICRRSDWLGLLVTDRMICAGKTDGSKDACQGDSGGPLSCYDKERMTWTLAGSVSWGIECGQPRQPGVYAKISFFADWIWKKIGQYEGWMEDEEEDEGSSGEGLEP